VGGLGAAVVLQRWHASPVWPYCSRGGEGGELCVKTGRREESARGGRRRQEKGKAAAAVGARLRRASTGGSGHVVKALGRGAGSSRAARGFEEERERRLVVRFGQPRKKKGEVNGGADSAMTGGKRGGGSGLRASTWREGGG
jgi:hypothetical protein